METKDYCTKENQNNFSKFERDVYSAIMLKYETFTAAPEVHLFAQICLDGTQNSNFGDIIGMREMLDEFSILDTQL